MTKRGILFTILNVAIYVVAAVVVFGWLTIRASNGGLFSSADATYEVVVPSAPAVEANKTVVVSEAGVTIGVVTNVEGVSSSQGSGAALELKITNPGPVEVRSDGSARLVIQNIIGEKAVQVLAGTDSEPAENGQTLAFADDGAVLEASDALAPIEDAGSIPEDPEVQGFVNKQEAELAEFQTDADAIVANVNDLSDLLSAQSAALDNIGRRSDEMLSVLAAHGGDIQNLANESAALAAETETLLDDELVVLEKGFAVAADTITLLANRAGEMNDALVRLPEIADDTTQATEELLRILRNEKGHYVYIGAHNLFSLDEILRILEKGKR